MCQGKGVESWSQREFPILKDYVDDLFCSAQGAVAANPAKDHSPVHELFSVLDEVCHFAELMKKGKSNKKPANAEVVDESAKDPPHLVETPKTIHRRNSY